MPFFLTLLFPLVSSFPYRFSTTDLKPSCDFHQTPTLSSCQGSWATAAVCSCSSRRCYQLDITDRLSTQYAINCIGGGACGGGLAEQAWKYLVSYGVPNNTCVPFLGAETMCSATCVNGDLLGPYLVKAPGSRKYAGVPAIQMAILQGGPVQACFDVYRDFYSYTPGTVYAHYWGGYEGYACVELLGWEGNSWLGFNHWLKNWGDEGKFFIQMGSCGIESDVWGADTY